VTPDVTSGAGRGPAQGRRHLPTAPTGSPLQVLAERAAERVGEGSRLLFEGGSWSGAQLAERARRVSGGLRRAGLAPGDRVVVCMANGPEVGVAYQALWRAGAVPTPVIFLLSEVELRHVLTDSGAALVVTTPEFLPKVGVAARGVASVRRVVVVGEVPPEAGAELPLLSFAELEAAEEGPLEPADPADLAALLYTGGTTGRSKGVLLSHDALSAAAWAAVATTHREGVTRSLVPLPLSHVYGLLLSVMGLHQPDPTTTVLMRWFDPAGWLDLAERERVQVAAVVPSMLQFLLAQPLEERDLSALWRISSGGAPLPREVADAVTRRLPSVEVVEGYGCTETAAIIATPVGRNRPGSVGLPAPGVEVRIERPDGTEARPGEDGEVCVRGPVLMSGYWQAPEVTEHVLRGGWLHTGDVGRLDDDGYLYVVDRLKDLIIRGGFNVYPRDVEDVMLSHPAVAACAVVGRPDPTYGEEVVAYVTLRPGATAGPEDLVAHGRAHLAATKYPREVHVVDTIPLTSVGKLDRKALRAQQVS
jgi:long-chain acyl-CoA synthetase